MLFFISLYCFAFYCPLYIRDIFSCGKNYWFYGFRLISVEGTCVVCLFVDCFFSLCNWIRIELESKQKRIYLQWISKVLSLFCLEWFVLKRGGCVGSKERKRLDFYWYLLWNKKTSYAVRNWFLGWASQGLNLGPSDYESAALTNWATSPFCIWNRWSLYRCEFHGCKYRILLCRWQDLGDFFWMFVVDFWMFVTFVWKWID